MLTVSAFLEKLSTPWYKILAGESLIEEKEIEHISVTEYPSAEAEGFVKNNEMILSAGVGLDSEEHFFDFVRQLHKAGASCLFISQPTNHLTLPNAVKEYFEEENPFPLVLIPWECRFADITKMVLDLLRNDIITEHDHFMEVQNQLLQEYLSNGTLKQAALILSRFFCSKVTIFDANNEVRSQSHPTADKSKLLSLASSDNRNLFPITSNNHLYGKVYLEPAEGEADYDKNLFTYYLSWPLALWFDKEWIIQTSNQSLKDDFIWEMTKAKSEDFENLCAKGHNLGLDLRTAFYCAVGSIYLNAAERQQVDDTWLKDNIMTLKEEIFRITRLYQWETLVTYQQGNLLLYIENREGFSIDVFMDTLWNRLHILFPQIYLAWGISEPSNEHPDFNKLYHNAKLALSLCTPLPDQNSYLKFKRTALHSVLSYLSADKEMTETIRSILAPVYEHDRLMGSDDLIHTLQCYLECKNLSEASRLLYLHRHSLTYRLNKIEELTGLSIKDPDDFFLLELCVRLGDK